MCVDRYGREIKEDDKITFVIPGNSTMQSGIVTEVYKNSVMVLHAKPVNQKGFIHLETNTYRRTSKNIVKEPDSYALAKFPCPNCGHTQPSLGDLIALFDPTYLAPIEECAGCGIKYRICLRKEQDFNG